MKSRLSAMFHFNLLVMPPRRASTLTSSLDWAALFSTLQDWARSDDAATLVYALQMLTGVGNGVHASLLSDSYCRVGLAIIITTDSSRVLSHLHLSKSLCSIIPTIEFKMIACLQRMGQCRGNAVLLHPRHYSCEQKSRQLFLNRAQSSWSLVLMQSRYPIHVLLFNIEGVLPAARTRRARKTDTPRPSTFS